MEGPRYKVLVVEDDKIAQMAFERFVRDENLPYDYTIAGSVSAANSILSTDKFDIVIVDYLLGDGTAFDVFNSIKDTPIIFATGAGNEELAVRAMKAGAYDYLIKDPVRKHLKVLPEIMKNAITRKKVEEELRKYHDNLEELVKERTEQLAKEKELLSVTLSSMGDGVVAVDAEKRIILFNEVAENLTGWKFEEVSDKAIQEVFNIINESTKEAVGNPIDKALKSGKIETSGGRDTLVSRSGSECPISATAAPIRKNNGTMIGVVMVFRDVSKEREIDRMKTDFVSSVSHELRTPLTSIKAYTATILRDPDMAEQTRREFLNTIDEESNRLARLIRALLEVSRLDSGVVGITREAVDIAGVIKRALSNIEPLADKKNIQLKTDIADELGKLQGDESRIQSVVTNLVDNAIKFTPERGQVSASARQQGENLVIIVSDTGMGIPKEALPKIFDRFYRVYRPGKQIQGTGLGLAIVNKIVTMNGGRIEVESKVDKGTTFTVVLPLTGQPALEAAAAK
jgi:PAS domain S-box-containing protein